MAENNSELQLKITLDDGSIVQGFLNIDKKAKQTSDNISKNLGDKGKGFSQVAEKVRDLGEGFQEAATNSGSFAKNIVTSIGPIGAVAAGVAATTVALTKLALIGEETNAVNTQFARIAESAGLSVDGMKDSIIDATKGLIDDEDALKIATKAIVALGSEADKIPQILDASRNVSKALGQDFKQTFENLSQFVETGNARVLKNYGIILDLDKAYKDAAKSIGISTAELTEQQKQLVRTNLFLDEVPKKFKSTAESVTPLKDELAGLSVAFGNQVDSITTKLSTVLSPAISSVLGSFRKALEGINLASESTSLSSKTSQLAAFNTTILEADLKIPDLQNKLNKLNESLQQTSSVAEKVQLNTQIQRLSGQIDSLKEKAEVAKIEIDKLGGSKVSNPSAADAVSTPETRSLTATPDQAQKSLEQKKLAEQELTTFLASEELKRAQNDIQIKQLSLSSDATFAEQAIVSDDILKKQLESQNIQHKINIAAVNKQFSGQEESQAINRALAVESVERTHQENLIAIKKKSESDKTKIQKASDQQQLGNLKSSLGVIATLQESSSKELQAIGKAAAITNATIDGYAAVQKALASAPPPFNFAIAAIVGVAAAANVAKIAGIGGGGGGGASADFSTGGGGISSSPNFGTELTPETQLERQKPETVINYTVQGSVFDNKEAGARLIDLVNEVNGDGYVIRQGTFA